MAKPNFSFQKRQKELARQKKKEEKKQRKLEKSASGTDDGQDVIAGESQDEPTSVAADQDKAEQ